MFDQSLIAPARDRACIKFRSWQREALWVATKRGVESNGIITAIMGAGKSVVIAMMCAAWRGRVIVSAPTIKLVEDLSKKIGQVTGEPVGAWYTHDKRMERITCVCVPSLQVVPVMTGEPVLWIADECHRTERDVVAAFIKRQDLAHSVGLSATPYLSGDGELSYWTHELYRYGVVRALAENVLVPMRVHYVSGTAGEKVDVDSACIDWIRDVQGPGIASARDIVDAEEFAEALKDAGIAAMAVHSRLPRPMLDFALGRLERGDIKCIVQVRMLGEGVDLPWLRWLCLRQKNGSRVAYSQLIGRVLRSSPCKEIAHVFDPHEVTLEHELQDAAAVAETPGLPASAETEESDPVEPIIDPLTGEEVLAPNGKEPKTVRVRTAAAKYISAAMMILKQAGLTTSASYAPGLRGWRWDPASAKQLDVLYGAESQCRLFLNRAGQIDDVTGDAARHLRFIALTACRAAGISRKYQIRKGPVSDLITVLFSAVRTSPEKRTRALGAIIASGLEVPDEQ